MTAIGTPTERKRQNRFVQNAEKPHLRASTVPVRSMRRPHLGASATLETIRSKRYFGPQARLGDGRVKLKPTWGMSVNTQRNINMANTQISTMLATATVLALAACSGGGATSQISPADVSILWESPRGTGFGLVRATSDVQSGVILVEDVNNPGSGFSSIEIVQIISTQTNADGSSSGEVVVRKSNGEISNLLGTFYDGQAALYQSGTGSDAITVASGSNPRNLPIGSYSYQGMARSFYVYNGGFYEENGRFDLDVQFSSGTGQLTADTDLSRYINNNIIVNNRGELSGVNGTFTVYDSDGTTVLDNRIIDFNGTFHGSGATHVSGIAVGGASTTDDYSEMGIVGKR